MSYFNPIKIITPSTLEAVTLTEAKEHLKIDGDDQNTIIRLYLSAAVKRCEDYRQAAIMSAEHELYTSCFYSPLSLQKHPVTSINSIKYYDEDNELQTIDAGDYRLQDFLQPASIEFDTEFGYPDTHSREYPVIVNFNAGYLSASSVPATIKLAILSELGDANEFRQNTLIGNGLTVADIKGVKEKTMGYLDAESMWI